MGARFCALDVVRPVAAEWDEKEETPWPVIQEAAEIGLYSWEFMAEAMMNDPTGLTMPVALEGTLLGRCWHWIINHGERARRSRHRGVWNTRTGNGMGSAVLWNK